jgi:hypothetical protein
MDTFKIYVICLIGIAFLTTITVFSNEIYAPFRVGNGFVQNNNIILSSVDQENKSEKFIQKNNFTITKLKDNLLKIGGWSSDGFVGNGTLSVILKFENGSKVSYNDVKTLGVEFGRGFISSNGFIQNNNDTMTPGGFGNGFVQNNNFIFQVGNGFVQNNNITLSGGIVTPGGFGNGFVQNNNFIFQVGNGFVQNNNITLSSLVKENNEVKSTDTDTFGGEGYSGFVQNNLVRGIWASGG